MDNDKENISLKEISDLRDYISKHFEIQANQRLTLFRFYSVFIVLYLYGVGYVFTHLDEPSLYDEVSGIVVSILFIFITSIFQNLDRRNHDIIDSSRQAICYIESTYKDVYKHISKNGLSKVKIFTLDEEKKKGLILTHTKWTHTKCFNLIFNVGYFLSAVVIILCLVRTNIFSCLC